MLKAKNMLNWNIEQLTLELKYTWKISRNASDVKLNSLITVGKGKYKGIGEVAPNIRYNETPENIISEFHRFIQSQPEKVQDIHELTTLLDSLKLPNALRFGIESAYIHYLCHADHTDIYTFLGIQKPLEVQTSFSLPIMDVSEIEAFYIKNNLSRFKHLKIKINSDTAADMLKEVKRLTDKPLIVDANEAWKNPDALLAFFETLTPFNIAIIEQPMPAGMNAEYEYLKQRSPFVLMADESICADADFEQLKKQFHGINMKLMKAGGYLNGLHLLNEAVKHNMRTMIGCMVETSLGISSAFHLCAGIEFVDLDGSLIVKNEPFGLVHEKDGVLIC
jgi:L-alanine-DL-glutamate epimerase-like enolase superfamily enzyme